MLSVCVLRVCVCRLTANRYLENLLRSIRSQALIEYLSRYSAARLSFLARHLNVQEEEVEDLLVMLLLDKKIEGQIDQENGTAILVPPVYVLVFVDGCVVLSSLSSLSSLLLVLCLL